MTNDPRGHIAAIRAALDSEPCIVDPVEPFACLIHACHDVVVVHPTPPRTRVGLGFRPADGAPPCLAVAGAAARVAVDDPEAGADLELELVEEKPSVGGERASVDVEDRGGTLASRDTTRSHGPALHLHPIGRHRGEALGCDHLGQLDGIGDRSGQNASGA